MSSVAWLFYFDSAAPITSVSVFLANKDGLPTTEFHRGDVMLITRENCASKRTAVDISRELVRDEFKDSYVMPSSPFVFEIGCETNTNGVVIPAYVLPGRYHYRVTVAYQNNALTHGQVVLKMPELTVLP